MARSKKVEELLTTEEAAELLGKHRTTITRMVNRGLLVPVKDQRAAYLFRRSDVEQAAEAS